MAKLFLLMFVWGPTMVGFSLGWLVVHPEDWTGPTVMGPVGALISFFTYRAGLRRLPTTPEPLRPSLIAGMTAGAVVGVGVFGMLVSGILD
jgi:hypothetical protein